MALILGGIFLIFIVPVNPVSHRNDMHPTEFYFKLWAVVISPIYLLILMLLTLKIND